MSIEGELVVKLDWDGQRVRGVGVRSTRPQAAARVLIGKTASDAAATVPLLFSVCGGAQGAAAACALAAAGAEGFRESDPSRDTGVLIESLQQGFWHLLIDWPDAMGSAPQLPPLSAARRLIAAATAPTASRGQDDVGSARRGLAAGLAELADREIFGMPTTRWLALPDLKALVAWADAATTLPARLLARLLSAAATLGRSDVAPMPSSTRQALLDDVVPSLQDDVAFQCAPTWAGSAVETGAYARTRWQPLVAACAASHGNGTVTRMVARLVEVALLLAELAGEDHASGAPPRVQAIALGAHAGMGAVETARGLLLHHARIRGQRVYDYRIVAPTEWNFHPDGALTRGLVGTSACDEDELMRAARLCVHALDPCVATRVEIGRA